MRPGWKLLLVSFALLQSASLLGLSGCSSLPPDRARDIAEAPACATRESEGVVILGEVQRPGRYPASVAPTLVAALEDAGGFTELAHRRGVTLRRCSRVVRLDVDAILQGEHEDPALRTGDVVMVPFRD